MRNNNYIRILGVYITYHGAFTLLVSTCKAIPTTSEREASNSDGFTLFLCFYIYNYNYHDK